MKQKRVLTHDNNFHKFQIYINNNEFALTCDKDNCICNTFIVSTNKELICNSCGKITPSKYLNLIPSKDWDISKEKK